jgi:hypothetical protein
MEQFQNMVRFIHPPQEICLAVFRSSYLQMAIETTNPSYENPEDNKNKQCGSDSIHNGFEMALIFCALYKTCRSADK